MLSDNIETYDFNELFSNIDDYTKVNNELRERFNTNFLERKNPAILKIDDTEFNMTLGKVFLNICLMKPYAELHMTPTKEDIFTADSMPQDVLEAYFNHILSEVKEINKDEEKIKYDDTRQAIADAEDELCDLSGQYNVNVGNTLSYRDFIRMETEDPEAAKLFSPKVKPGQFHEIENQFKQAGKDFQAYFEKHKDAEIYPFIASETGLNIKQAVQCFMFVGLKPNMEGQVIPVVIKDNFLHGLTSLESYYINSCGTRLALTTNKKYTKRSGYLTRKLSLANIDHYHDDSIKDCGTKHYLIYNVNNKEKLNMILGRQYYDINDKNEKTSDVLKTITEKSKDLIGKKIGLRSPVACCGEHVCATCYGRELSRINKDANTGLIATLKLTEPLTQRLLSAKHLLSTKSENIDWGKNFPDVFRVNLDSIYFVPDTSCSVSFVKPTVEDYDEDEDAYFVTKISVLQAGTKKAVEYISPTKLFINSKFLPVEKMKDDDPSISINSKNVGEDEYVFKYHVKNAELTRSLQEILDLIENSDHLGISNYDDLVNKFDDLLIENGLNYINSVHIEMICAVLIRNLETGKRLDFSKAKLDEYVIDRVSKAIMDGPLATSLSFERINDQLIDLKTYSKDEVSMMDALFL